MVGKKIRMLRHQKGWNQEEAANKLAISIPAYSKIETGVTDVNLSRLEQIAALFSLSTVELLALNENGETRQSIVNLELVNKKLKDRETEIIELQKKLIDLFEQLKEQNQINSQKGKLDL
jgi:transcriptional regulator with XRE-family HTH domain